MSNNQGGQQNPPQSTKEKIAWGALYFAPAIMAFFLLLSFHLGGSQHKQAIAELVATMLITIVGVVLAVTVMTNFFGGRWLKKEFVSWVLPKKRKAKVSSWVARNFMVSFLLYLFLGAIFAP